MQLKLMLLLFGVSFFTFIGCEKHDNDTITIAATNLESPKPGTLTGTFTATGEFNTSGTHLMLIQPVGTDSIYCTTTFTAPEGTFIMSMHCSFVNNTGHWNITSGTGHFAVLRGGGSLIMVFPPDPSVPSGALGVETMTGEVHLHH